MPAHKLPLKLYDLVCARVADLIDIACNNICHAFGPVIEIETLQAISHLQNFLTTYIPVSVLDDLFNRKKSGIFLNACCISHGDIRILLALIMYEQMRVFKISNLDIPYILTSKIEESFWIGCLNRMTNLVLLDLSLVCTDEILKVVGNCCPLLEQVNVTSKMSRTSQGGNFNALRKVYHVSDQGLSYLTKCQNLKHVTLNASNRSGLGNITEKGISILISSLPQLKSINYEYMGSVLQHIPSTNPPLCLQQLKDLRTNPASIQMYNKLCPSLLLLHIALPTNLCSRERGIQSEALEENLAISTLKLKILHQSFIWLTNNLFEKLLALKGENLICIVFGLGCNNFDLNSLILIGQYCPNLVEMAINSMGPNDTVISTFPKNKSAYKRLKNLHLSGISRWDINQALTLCLQGSQVVDLYVCGAHTHLDDVFTKLLLLNYFIELKHMFLHHHCYISKDTLWQILKGCPQISRIFCLFQHSFTPDDIASFQIYIHKNNYDVDLKISSGFNSFWLAH
jgi:hypothetical protein